MENPIPRPPSCLFIVVYTKKPKPHPGVLSTTMTMVRVSSCARARRRRARAAVEGDAGDVKLMRPLLKNTNLEFLQLKEVYSSSNPLAGFRPEAFHAGVDRKGPCIVIARTQGGAVCGGDSPKGFAGYGEYRGSIAAFLFTWPDGDTSKPAVKLQKIGGASMACCPPESYPQIPCGLDPFGAPGF